MSDKVMGECCMEDTGLMLTFNTKNHKRKGEGIPGRENTEAQSMV